ncbi:MAG TPA: NUDIX hydrolase [Propionibacteriaceae bacterium]|nr:NUDIX hydrolase [Propionibacteriaceae bacterium]
MPSDPHPLDPDAAGVRIRVDGDSGVVEWVRAAEGPGLAEALAGAADAALGAQGLRRLEASVPDWDHVAVRALHRAGFRREGRLRDAWRNPDATHSDRLIYARLAGDRAHGAHGFTAVMDSVLPTKRVIGHVVFTDPHGRVLLLETRYKDDWELPGGIVEPGEPPVLGAQREVREELGLEVRLGQPRLVDWMPPLLGWSDAIEFIWYGGTLAAGRRFDLPDLEISGYHWATRAEIPRHVTELSARRIGLVLDSSGFVFTVDGFPHTTG